MSLQDIHALSVATVGTKGQIVIPLEIRERLKINPGDKVVLLTRDSSAAMIFPMDGMQAWLDKMTADFDQLRTVVVDEKTSHRKERNNAPSHQ